VKRVDEQRGLAEGNDSPCGVKGPPAFADPPRRSTTHSLQMQVGVETGGAEFPAGIDQHDLEGGGRPSRGFAGLDAG
jgi:hypothetical protein